MDININTNENIRDWVLEQTDARNVLRSITKQSLRLGVFLACKVAREALRFLPEGEGRPLQAIEAAERWVRGAATDEECERTATAAFAAANAASTTAYAAASYAAFAASYAAFAHTYEAAANYAAFAASDAANAAANAVADANTPVWKKVRSEELRRLCSVIANDMFTGRTAEVLKA